MSRTEPAQGSQKLIEVYVLALPVELAKLSSPCWRRKRSATTSHSCTWLLVASLFLLTNRALFPSPSVVEMKFYKNFSPRVLLNQYLKMSWINPWKHTHCPVFIYQANLIHAIMLNCIWPSELWSWITTSAEQVNYSYIYENVFAAEGF